MRLLFIFALLLSPVFSAAQTTAFTNANVVTGNGDEVLRSVTLVVDGMTIRALGADVTVPEGATVIDVQGRYVLPGLIDAHAHIADLAAARRALVSGVTTVRSANTPHFEDVALRELARLDPTKSPETLAAGAFVTPHLGDRALADPALVHLLTNDGAQSEAALRHLVRVNLARGADVIKTRGTERAGLPDTDPRKQVYTQEQLGWIVDEARKGGAHVLVHAHGDEGARAAVLAGARSIEHGTYLSEETLRLMRARGTFLVPTYAIVRDLAEPGGDYDDPVLLLRGRHMQPRLEATIRRAYALGVPLVASTDTGYGPGSVTRVTDEIAYFGALGLTPLEAIRSATSVAADLLEIADRTGTLAPGMEADLIVVAEDPLADLRAVRDVVLVMSNGVFAVNRLPFGK